MQPFLLEFVNSQAFSILMTGLAIGLVLGAIAVVVGLVVLGRRLHANWRWWQNLAPETRPIVARRYFVDKAKTLVILAVAVVAVELLLHYKQRAYERSPANVFHREQDSLRDQVPGEYILPDTLLPARARAAQQGQDGWSPTTTRLPPATLVQLVVRANGTFTYASKLPTDYTPTGEGTWEWQSLNSRPDNAATYGPVFYIAHKPSQQLWAVRSTTGFSFFGSYELNAHESPFALKRPASPPIAAP